MKTFAPLLVLLCFFANLIYAEDTQDTPRSAQLPGEFYVVVMPDKDQAGIGENVTYFTRVYGGIPPFRYFWFVEGSTAWFQYEYDGRTAWFSSPMPYAGKVSMWAIVHDSQGNLSNQFKITTEVPDVSGQLKNNSPAGKFKTTYGEVILTYDPATREIDGTFVGRQGHVKATLNPNLELRENRYALGEWQEYDFQTNSLFVRPFFWDFSQDWSSFGGAWKNIYDTDWQAGWTGTRL